MAREPEKDEPKKDARQERAARMYDHESSRKHRGEGDGPEPKREEANRRERDEPRREREEGGERRRQPGEAEPRPEHVKAMLGGHKAEREAMHMAHEKERLELHGTHRGEHRTMHVRHEEEMAEAHAA